jgi:putative chitinase
MPNLSPAKAEQYLPMLNAAMAEGQINTPQRQAAFLAQLAQESGQLQYFEELADGCQYQGRLDLGNIQPGDGQRFKGRGPIQLTGRWNYQRAGQDLGLDLVHNPALAARPDVGFRTAQWYWTTHHLNAVADEGPAGFDDITRAVNGGLTGKAQRDMYYSRALGVLGAR